MDQEMKNWSSIKHFKIRKGDLSLTHSVQRVNIVITDSINIYDFAVEFLFGYPSTVVAICVVSFASNRAQMNESNSPALPSFSS